MRAEGACPHKGASAGRSPCLHGTGRARGAADPCAGMRVRHDPKVPVLWHSTTWVNRQFTKWAWLKSPLGHYRRRPSRRAFAMADLMLMHSSLEIALAVCLAAVPPEMPRMVPISSAVLPSVHHFKTSTSLKVSP